MTATGQNFEMHQGDRKQVEIPVTNELGAALDLGPFTEVVWVVYHPTTKNIVLTKSLGDGITVPIVSDGVIIIDLLPEDTVDIIPNTYNHECEISDGADVVATVTTGTIKIIFSKA